MKQGLSTGTMEEFAMAIHTLDRFRGTLDGLTEVIYHIKD